MRRKRTQKTGHDSRIFNDNEVKLLKTFSEFSSYVVSTVYFKSFGCILSGGGHGKLLIFNRETYECLASIKPHTDDMNNIEVLDEEKGRFITCGYDGIVQEYSLQREPPYYIHHGKVIHIAGPVLRVIKITSDQVLVFHEDESNPSDFHIISVNQKKIIRSCCNLNLSNDWWVRPFLSKTYPNSLLLNTNRFERNSKAVILIDYNTNFVVRFVMKINENIYGMSSLRNQQNEEIVIVTGSSQGIFIFNTGNPETRQEWNKNSTYITIPFIFYQRLDVDCVRSMSIHETGGYHSYLSIGSADGRISMFQLDVSKLDDIKVNRKFSTIHSLHGNVYDICEISRSSDSMIIAGGCFCNKLLILEVKNMVFISREDIQAEEDEKERIMFIRDDIEIVFSNDIERNKHCIDLIISGNDKFENIVKFLFL